MAAETVSEQALEKAVDAFARELAREYTNRLQVVDMDAVQQAAIKEACRLAANAWLSLNAPRSLIERAEERLRGSLEAVAQGTFVEGRTDSPAAREKAKAGLKDGSVEGMASALRAIVVDMEGKYKPSQATLMDSLEALDLYVQATGAMPREQVELEQTI